MMKTKAEMGKLEQNCGERTRHVACCANERDCQIDWLIYATAVVGAAGATAAAGAVLSPLTSV